MGTAGVTTSGSGNTITITGDGTLATTYDEDTGSATPALGILKILGINGITTSGSGNTVTIDGSGLRENPTIQVFTTSGTYTPTVGMRNAFVQMLGGGGAGGGQQTNGSPGGGGGGGGEFSEGIFSAASIGASQTVTIGAGGTANNGAPGGNGGTTSLGILMSCGGGQGGQISNTSIGTGSLGGVGGTGGTGGQYRCNGNGGGYTARSTTFEGGYGANSTFGAGGRPGFYGSSPSNTNEAGFPATGHGAGGGGGWISPGYNEIGGNGSSGLIIITEYS